MLSLKQSADPIPELPKRKIMVADDDTEIRRLFAFALREAGYDIVTAADGAETLSKVQSEHPDLLILDVMMPEMDGLEVCWRLRDIPETARLPIIMVSAKGQVPDRVSGLHVGADDYMVKPVSLDELLARVSILLNRTRYPIAQPQEPESGKLYAFMGVKGGVGTTVTVLNVATVLALQKKSVIVVELRPDQGTFALHFKWHGSENLYHLLSREVDGISEKTVKARLHAPLTGLRVLYGPQKPAEFGELDAHRVALLLDKLIHMADYVLLDLPYAATAANRVAVTACDLVSIVMETDANGLYCAKSALGLLSAWDILGALVGVVLVNRTGAPGAVALRDVGTQLGSEIVGVVPFAADISAGAVLQGLPMVVIRPEHTVTAAFKEIVRRITADTLIGLRL